MQVNHITDSSLSARLPRSWLPLGDGTALLEASMRQRGYEVQILALSSTMAKSAAQYIFLYVPTPNTTAFELVLNVRTPTHILTASTRTSSPPAVSNQYATVSAHESALCSMQLTGPAVTPFNVQKQTALMAVMARTFPRLAFGFGPQQSRVVSVYDYNATATATVTIRVAADGNPQGFAEVRHARTPALAECLRGFVRYRAQRRLDNAHSMTDGALLGVAAVGVLVGLRPADEPRRCWSAMRHGAAVAHCGHG